MNGNSSILKTIHETGKTNGYKVESPRLNYERVYDDTEEVRL